MEIKTKQEEVKKGEQEVKWTQTTQTSQAQTDAEKKDTQLQELTATLQRIHADFENYKKRAEKEKAHAADAATAKVIQQLLPIIDTFQLALKNTSDHALFTKGIEMLYAQLCNTMQSCGVRPIEAMGQKLDPNRHEVLIQDVRDNCDDDTIVEELQKGYTLNGVVIRTSKVKIAKRRQKDAQSTDDNKGNTARKNP